MRWPKSKAREMVQEVIDYLESRYTGNQKNPQKWEVAKMAKHLRKAKLIRGETDKLIDRIADRINVMEWMIMANRQFMPYEVEDWIIDLKRGLEDMGGEV